jgi:hypothetical protein
MLHRQASGRHSNKTRSHTAAQQHAEVSIDATLSLSLSLCELRSSQHWSKNAAVYEL